MGWVACSIQSMHCEVGDIRRPQQLTDSPRGCRLASQLANVEPLVNQSDTFDFLGCRGHRRQPRFLIAHALHWVAHQEDAGDWASRSSTVSFNSSKELGNARRDPNLMILNQKPSRGRVT